MRRVAVYCGSNDGADPAFAGQVDALCDALTAAELDLVYGGSRNGLMGRLADGMLARRRTVTGVMPEGLIAWEQAHPGISELIRVASMHERKRIMAERADGFIAFAGGIGTLEEIFEMISWAQLGIHHKPCAFLNTQGYYDKLVEFLDHSVRQGLMREQLRRMILIAEDPAELLSRMAAYRSPVDHQWLSGAES